MDEVPTPAPLIAEHFVLPGLPVEQSQVLAAACELVVLEPNAGSSIDLQTLLDQLGKKHETSKEQCSQALENLQRTGYIEGAYGIGSKHMRHFRVATPGFTAWLKAVIDYPASARAVAEACLTKHDSASVASAAGLPEPVVNHFLEQLASQKYLILSAENGNPKTFGVRDEAGLKYLAKA